MVFDDLFDRRGVLTLVAAFAVQAATVIWWASARDSDAHFQQQRVASLEQSITQELATQNQILERIARIEERQIAAATTLTHIEKTIEDHRRP